VKLLDASGNLPRASENGATFQIEDARIGVPRGRNGDCTLERQVGIVKGDDVSERVHAHAAPPTETFTARL
jgi:hypothetical protein